MHQKSAPMLQVGIVDLIVRHSCNVEKCEREQDQDDIADALQLGTSDARLDKQFKGGLDAIAAKK